MINIRNLKIDPSSLGSAKLLVDIIPAYQYQNGQRMDTVSGFRYTVALPEHGLEKLGVKIDGKQLMEKPEGFVEVEFSGLEVFVYMMEGKPCVGARATGITLANKKP